MAGYTRTFTKLTGDTINASDFNDEYQALEDAFAFGTGHTHDGSAGEGDYVPLISDSNNYNAIEVDSANDEIDFHINVSNVKTQQLKLVDGALIPAVDNDLDLGSTSFEFKDLYIDGTANIDTIAADTATIGNLTLTSNLVVNGNTTIGNAATDTVTLTADVASSITPSADNSYDLGAVGAEWRNLYIDGTANIDSLVANTADINGGTIDGVSIGQNTAVTALTVDNITINTASITSSTGTISFGNEGLITTGYLSTGTGTPATGGAIRMPNAQGIYWRNTAGTADINLRLDNADVLSFGWDGIDHFEFSETTFNAKDNTITTTGPLNCGAFTSTGIDDNATAEALQLFDSGMALGSTGTNFGIYQKSDAQQLKIAGGASNASGANIVLNGPDVGGVGNGGDLVLKSGANTFLGWDESVGTLTLYTDSGSKTTALTIDSSQKSTFSGTLSVDKDITEANQLLNKGQHLLITDGTSGDAGTGSSLGFVGDDGGGNERTLAVIRGYKGSAGSNFDGGLKFYTRQNGVASVVEVLDLDENQNATFAGNITVDDTRAVDTYISVGSGGLNDSGYKITRNGSVDATLTVDASEDLLIAVDPNNLLANSNIRLSVDGTTAITINSDHETTFAGAVGIGAAPASGSNVDIADAVPDLRFIDTTDSTNTRLRRDFNVFLIEDNGSEIYRGYDSAHVFKTNGATTALTIDSSQNATFTGTVTADQFTANCGASNYGAFFISTDSLCTLSLNDNTTTSTDHVGVQASGDSLNLRSGQLNTMVCDATGRVVTNGATALGAEAGSVTISTGDSGVTSANSNYDDLVVEGNGNTGISILCPTTSFSSTLCFGDSNDTDAGRIQYNNQLDFMQFVVGSSEVGRWLSGGGLTFNGDTATANALDDYEEGTWTPVLTDSTNDAAAYDYQVGTYTKVGNKVTAICRVGTTDIGSVSGGIYVDGLPFTQATTVATAPVYIGYAGGMALTAGESITGSIASNQAIIVLRKWSATTGTAQLTDSDWTADGDIMLSVTYFV